MLVERKEKNFPRTYNHKVMFKDLQRLIGSQSDVNRSTISPRKTTTSKTKRQTALDMELFSS